MKINCQIRLLNKLHMQNIGRFLKYTWDARNPGEKNFYQQFIHPGDLCFDIGANIGRKTDLFLKLNARVVCVEPQKDCLRFLQWRYRWNKNVICIGSALDSDEGIKSIYVCEANALSTLSDEWIENAKRAGHWGDLEWRQQEKITTTTLDRLIDQYGLPAYCKIDVEGYELNVLKGLSKPIGMISIEINPHDSQRNMDAIECLGCLGDYSYNISVGERPVEFVFPRWMGKERIREILINNFETYRFGELYARINK